MGKRLRKNRSICCCKSPPLRSNFTSLESFKWFEEDLWTEIAKFLDGKSLVKLAATSRWFYKVIMDDCVWKFACVRDLQVLAPCPVAFKWNKLYGSLADGSHSYSFNDKGKHIDWMRIGAFSIDSHVAVLTEQLSLPLKIRRIDTNPEKMLESSGTCMLSNIKTGIWIADLQLVRCPVCELDSCDGTMQALDVRHIELFLHQEFRDGSWKHDLIGSHKIDKPIDGASGAIFDLKHLKDRENVGVFDVKQWSGKPGDFQPKAIVTYHSVAINTNLQDNQGILTKFYMMKAGSDGEVVSIRICQQLL